MPNDVSMKVSPQTHARISTICRQLEKILNKRSVSVDQALRVILSVKHVEEAITDMVLEIDTPEWEKAGSNNEQTKEHEPE